MTFTAADVYRDALTVYRLLFRRSVATAAVVFGADAAIRVWRHANASRELGILLGLVGFAFDWGGPVLVQGALVEIVRNLHEAQRPERIHVLYSKAGRRLRSLLWASLVYGFGVTFGLLLLIVPGVIAAARWCLMAPLIMLDEENAGFARERSKLIVRGRTPSVAVVIVAAYLVLNGPLFALAFMVDDIVTWTLVWFVWNSLTAPYYAHMLTVLYSRFTDPERPVVAPEVFGWRSFWEGA